MGLYFENRQNTTETSDEELERIFKCMADYFGHDWLRRKNGANPLQELWNRKDALSTAELFYFGSCFEKLEAVDRKWLKTQVKHIKGDQANSRLGAFFEIIGLGMLLHSNYDIRPTKGDNPGFDGIFSLQSGNTMRLSLKNYGDSSHYREFSVQAKKFEILFVKEISDRKIVNVQAFISCPEVPSPEKWRLLFENIKPILDKFSSASPVFMHIDNFWVIGLTPLEQRSDYVKERSSYTVIISAPFHKNEHKNLFSKLDEACENLIKHTQTESNSTVNAALIHLPENASVAQCRIWIEEYFAIQPPKPITAVILFQPTITTNLEKNTSAIHNCFQFIVREEKLSQWNTIGQPIQLTPIVGYVEINSAKNQLIAERDGKKEAVDFDGYYLFQRGNHYLEAQAEEGKMFGIVPKLASGVFVHSHIKIFPDQPSFNISGIYPPVDKLLIV